MRKTTLTNIFSIVSVSLFLSSPAFAQIGIGTTDPKSEALLDIESEDGDKGILIPRVSIADLSTLAPITSNLGTATESLLVYNTNTTTGKGFYYWNGTNQWIAVGGTDDKHLGTDDQTLSGNRTLNFNGFELTFSPNSVTNINGGELRLGSNANHAMRWAGTGATFNGNAKDGIALYGFNGGILGAKNGTENIALEWFQNGQVKFNQYTGTTFSGNPTNLLGVDNNGNMVKMPVMSAYEAANSDWFEEGITPVRPPDNINDNIYTFGEVGIGLNNPNAALHLYEATGTAPSGSDGTMILEHGNPGGQSSIVFKSRTNSGSDFGYISYSDDGSPNGSSTENSLLEIGIQNDVDGAVQDDIRVNSSGSFLLNTGGSERMKVNDAGQVMINTATPNNNRMTVVGSTNQTAINTTSSGTGTSIRSINSGSGDALWATNTGTGSAIYSTNEGPFPTIYANSNGGYDAIESHTNNSDIYMAVWGTNLNAEGTGIVGGSGGISTFSQTGSGIAGSGPKLGVFGYAGEGSRTWGNRGNAAGRFTLDSDSDPDSDNDRATAELAGFDYLSTAYNSTSDTGDGSGNTSGNLSQQYSYYGGYFSGGDYWGNPSYSYAGIKYNTNSSGNGGTNFKIIGNGTNSTLIQDEQGTPRIMFSPEAPEILFQDYGVGKLINGEARIEIDEVLKKSLYVDEQHPLKVFVTLEGDCNGVYVTDKSINGFTVKELAGGTSNVSFSWQIVANRADDKDASGNITSKHVGLRLPVGPAPLKPRKAKSKEIKDRGERPSEK